MRRAERVISLLQGLLGVGLLVGSSTLKPGKGGDPGPGLFPALLGALCLVTAAGLVIRGLRTASDEPPAVNGRWRLALGFVAISTGYVVLVPILGYFVATALTIPLVIWYLGMRSPRWVIGSAVGYILFAWLVFYYLFMMPLPEGFLARIL